LTYRYAIFGLNMDSDLELQECDPGHHDGPADIILRTGKVSQDLDSLLPFGSYMHVSRDTCLITAKGVARYLVVGGKSITIEIEEGAGDLEVRAYFLGTALGAVLHQRRMIPLHVSVVASPAGLIAFSGQSGAGKSTLAAAIHLEYGWPILTDDLAVLSVENDAPSLRFGVRRLRLWKDAIALLDIDERPTSKVIARDDKFQFDLVPQSASNERSKIAAVCLLENGVGPDFSPITGVQALVQLGSCLYRPELAAVFNDKTHLMARMTNCLKSVGVYRLSRPIPEMKASEVATNVVEWADLLQEASGQNS
jgi:hypothetical protein